MKNAMNWKKWKVGLVIALLSGVFAGCAGLVGSMDWKAFVAVVCASIATNLGNYLRQHPIESIQEETKARTRAGSFFALLLVPLLICGCRSLEQTAYVATGATVATVDAAMQAWGDYVAEGHATPEQEAAVKLAYERYQKALRAEQIAVKVYRANKDKLNLKAALNALAEARDGLLQVLPGYWKKSAGGFIWTEHMGLAGARPSMKGVYATTSH